MVTGPEKGAVQRYQTECVELFEPGSPGCHVAYLFVPLVETEVPLMSCEPLKGSFAGGGEVW
jgi:hypothetical protein